MRMRMRGPSCSLPAARQVNSTPPRPFVFRNYNHHRGEVSRYPGCSRSKQWLVRRVPPNTRAHTQLHTRTLEYTFVQIGPPARPARPILSVSGAGPLAGVPSACARNATSPGYLVHCAARWVWAGLGLGRRCAPPPPRRATSRTCTWTASSTATAAAWPTTPPPSRCTRPSDSGARDSRPSHHRPSLRNDTAQRNTVIVVCHTHNQTTVRQ